LVAAVASIVVLPSLFNGAAPGRAPTGSAAIASLSVAAGGGPTAPAPPGQYLHIVDRERFGHELDVIQTWTNHDGLRWFAYSANQGNPPLVTWGENDTAGASLRFMDSLPTTGSGLAAYLDTHVTGSSTKDEAIFTAVGDLIRLQGAPPALRAAAFQVLEHTAHITTEPARDSLNRTAVKVTFHDPTGESGPTSLLFDPATSVLLEEQEGPQATFTYTQDIVSAVPARVRQQAGPPPAQPSAPPPLSQLPNPQPSWSPY
jgi:hypothetical protein